MRAFLGTDYSAINTLHHVAKRKERLGSDSMSSLTAMTARLFLSRNPDDER
jgi:hypothetical protein